MDMMIAMGEAYTRPPTHVLPFYALRPAGLGDAVLTTICTWSSTNPPLPMPLANNPLQEILDQTVKLRRPFNKEQVSRSPDHGQAGTGDGLRQEVRMLRRYDPVQVAGDY